MLQKQGFFSTLFLYRTQVNYSTADDEMGRFGLNTFPMGEIQFKIVSFLLAHTKIYENPKDRYSTKPACSLAS